MIASPRSGMAVGRREKIPLLWSTDCFDRKPYLAHVRVLLHKIDKIRLVCNNRAVCVFSPMAVVAPDLTNSFLSSLRLTENGGRGSTTTASRSSSRHMKIVMGQKLSAPRIIWQKLQSGRCLVPAKEALIPRTRDTRERTNQRIFPAVELISRI